jgi:murein DD-endopeptidase MepM/ murein hydrolase activator NlpD
MVRAGDFRRSGLHRGVRVAVPNGPVMPAFIGQLAEAGAPA